MEFIKRRVFNLTTRCYVKRAQAEGWLEHGVCAWVERGATIRNLTLPEMVAGRGGLPGDSDSFPYAEVPGVVTDGIEGMRRERNMAWQGTLFAVPSLAQELALTANPK